MLLHPLLRVSLLMVIGSASLVKAYGNGAPHHRCSNLVPFHGSDPQTSSPPYEFEISPTRYSPGDNITVTLRGLNGAKFKGFAVTAHRLTGDTEDLVGGFVASANAQGSYWYNAIPNVPNCLTHVGGELSEVKLNWIAPARSIGDVAFTTPVVQSRYTYWANVTSSVVVANLPSQDAAFPPLNIGSSPSPISGSCGTNFGCVRSPALCDLANCEVYVKFLETEGRLKLELQATGSYISLGLSDDNKMRDDLTLTCTAVKENDFSMQIGYNPNYRSLNERHRWTPMQDKYIQQVGNRIRCEFNLPLVINITTYPTLRHGSSPQPIVRSFDLRNTYYVFIAYGKTYPGTSSVVKHVEMPAISDGKVNLLGRGSYSAHRISALRRAHGSVMLLAWQVLLPLGANLAMFYRSLFSKSLGGVQLWFHLHRGIVLSAFVLTIIGMLLIFAQFGWSWTSSNSLTVAHGAMGMTLLCLAVIQIIMGIFRPGLDAPRRPLFKLAHTLVGYSAMGLADSVLIIIGFLASLPEHYRINHLVFAFVWLTFHTSFRIAVGILQNRWMNRASVVADKLEDQAAFETKKRKILLWLFATFLAGMVVIFLAWLINLLLF